MLRKSKFQLFFEVLYFNLASFPINGDFLQIGKDILNHSPFAKLGHYVDVGLYFFQKLVNVRELITEHLLDHKG